MVASYGVGREKEERCEDNPEAASGADEVEHGLVHGRRLQRKNRCQEVERQKCIYICVRACSHGELTVADPDEH